MKKMYLAAVAALVLAGGITFWACNKENDTQAKTDIVSKNNKNLEGGTVFTARYGDNDCSQMTVFQKTEDEIIINTESVPYNEEITYQTILFKNQVQGVNDPKTGEFLINIPKDGKKYWLIPFNPKGEVKKAQAGETTVVNCDCQGGAGKCVLISYRNPNGSTQVECVPNPICKSCCKMSLTIFENTTPSTPVAASYMYVYAMKVSFNGKIYE